jgi:hypothetical protein
MVALANGFEGANGDPITVANSGGGGDPLDQVNGNCLYDTSWSIAGLSSFHAAPVAASTTVVRWSTSFGSQNVYWLRTYAKLSAAVRAVTTNLYRQSDPTNAQQWNLRLETDGTLTLVSNASGALWTSTNAYDDDAAFRFEVSVDWDGVAANATVKIDLYRGANLHGVVPDETSGSQLVPVTQPAGNEILGLVGSALTYDARFDGFAVSTVGAIGPIASTYFRPPTVKRYFDESPAFGKLMSRVPYQQGLAVLDNGGVLSTFPGLEVVTQDQAAAADHVYYGGAVNGPLSAAEITNLVAAGYSAYLSTTPP